MPCTGIRLFNAALLDLAGSWDDDRDAEEICLDIKKNRLNYPIKISAVTLMELYYGAYKSQRIESNLAKVKKIESSFEVVPASGTVAGGAIIRI